MPEDGSNETIIPIAPETVFTLKHDPISSSWRLREDVKRVILYEYDNVTAQAGKQGLLHPTEAIVLSLFDGSTFDEVSKKVAFLFNLEEMQATEFLSKIARRRMEEGALTLQASSDFPHYAPAQFAMKADQVDLTTRWLYKPLTLMVRLTEACARQCRYCNVERRPGLELLPVSRWLEIVEEAIDNGVVSFTFSGGDPLLYKGCIEIAHAICRRGLQPIIATKIHVDKKLACALRDIGLERIQISIDSIDKDVEDYLVNSEGAHEELLDSIANAKEAGLKVRTNSVITPYNVFSFPTLAQRLMDLGVEAIGTSQYGRTLFSENPDEFFLSRDSAKWLEAQVKVLKERNIPVNFGFFDPIEGRATFASRAKCSAGLSGLNINADGTVFTCDQLPIEAPFIVGDIRKQSLMEVWQSEDLNRFRIRQRDDYKGSVCHTCEDFEVCANGLGICFRNSFFAYGTVFGPAPNCPKAPVPKNRV